MQLRDIRLLFDYNYWATRRIVGIVATMDNAEFIKDRSSSHGGIRGTLAHTMGAEGIWLNRWKEEPVAYIPKETDFPELESLVQRWAPVERDVMAFCENLKSDEEIERVFHYKDLKGNPYSSRLCDAMQHLVNHSTYHRGQVVTMLRQAGVKPVATDLIAFYRELEKETK
jgi:uncharacterized damage-inducible protein DinB